MAFLSHATSYRSYHQNRCSQVQQTKNQNVLTVRKESAEVLAKISKIYEQNRSSSLAPNREIVRQPEAAQEYPKIRDEIEDLWALEIPFQVFKTAPKEVVGAGMNGIVYLCEDKNKQQEAFKIDFEDEWETSTDQADSPRKIKSFQKAKDLASMLLSLPASPYLIKVKGLGYIEDQDVWGVIYEKIKKKVMGWFDLRERIPFEKFLPAMLKVMLGSAKALLILDQGGHPHDDMELGQNVLVDRNGNPTVIDLCLTHKPDRFIRSRSKFGQLLEVSICKAQDKFKEKMDVRSSDLYKQVKSLGLSCQDWSKSMEAFGWQDIIDKLEEIQSQIR